MTATLTPKTTEPRGFRPPAGWGQWARQRGVYLALAVLVLYNVVFTAHFNNWDTLRCCSPSFRPSCWSRWGWLS